MNTLGGAVYIGRFVGTNNLKSARHVADIKNVSARSADGLIDDTGMSARKVLVDWRNVLYLSVGYVAEKSAGVKERFAHSACMWSHWAKVDPLNDERPKATHKKDWIGLPVPY